MKPKDIKKLQRQARLLEVRQLSQDLLLVASKSSPHAHHIVTIHRDQDGNLRARCSCPWAQNGGYGCSHVMAAVAHLAETQQRAVSFWPTKDEAERQRNRILHLAGDLREEDNGLWITTRPLRSA
jgi:hypothetical protein